MTETDKRSEVTITTDGAARGNPGPGGWAALLQHGERERLLVGEEPLATTNNAMELEAAAQALETLKRPCRVTLRADSTYLIDGLERLIAGGAPPQKNRAIWERLAAAARRHTIAFEWVRGHSGDPRNERVNAEANAAASRAYAASEAGREVTRPADGWTLALRSPAAGRPARWALLTPQGRREGTLARQGDTEPTAMYRALVEGLMAAHELAASAPVTLIVITNYELLVKQGRGEWRVKNPAQRELAAQAEALRRDLGDVSFEFAPTERVNELLDSTV